MTATLRIGTRGSQLALWQARTVAALLERRGCRAELVIIKTTGDRIQDQPLTDAGGKRLFVKEIEEALLAERVDLAVHSAKDMPSEFPPGLGVAAVLPREDPRDALVLPGAPPLAEASAAIAALGAAPSIGTSSIRRIAQLAMLLAGARFVPMRGNVDTRLRKLDDEGLGAIVLAAAGLKRLGFESRISALLPAADCIPAPGQGIVAIQIRERDRNTFEAVHALDDAEAAASLRAERALVAALGGGCQLPLGALATHDRGSLHMQAIVASPDGARAVRRSASGTPADAAGLGRRLAGELAGGGAIAILDEVR